MRTLIITAALALSSSALSAGNAEKGKDAYVKNGCWQCHGLAAQGGVAGPKLAPNPMPVQAFMIFVRNSNRAMPPYQKAILPDADLADIHAYLQTIPVPKDYKSIPLLNQ